MAFIVAGQHREIVYNSVSSRLKFYGWFPQNNTSIFKQEKVVCIRADGICSPGEVWNSKCWNSQSLAVPCSEISNTMNMMGGGHTIWTLLAGKLVFLEANTPVVVVSNRLEI